ncbi:MAG TPA: hypothetical protein VFH80_24595, partial [Solirubrobacteraceae bacterium]|nr:hypothetical protein [Solirubrobacteraceae bacterium]
MKRIAPAALIAALLVFAAPAAAKTRSHYFPRHAHCRAHYRLRHVRVAKRHRVRRHGRVVWLK